MYITLKYLNKQNTLRHFHVQEISDYTNYIDSIRPESENHSYQWQGVCCFKTTTHRAEQKLVDLVNSNRSLEWPR